MLREMYTKIITILKNHFFKIFEFTKIKAQVPGPPAHVDRCENFVGWRPGRMDERTLDVQHICTCRYRYRSEGHSTQTIRLLLLFVQKKNCNLDHFFASGQPAGYGFVEFATPYEAEQTLLGWNGRPVPNHPSGVEPCGVALRKLQVKDRSSPDPQTQMDIRINSAEDC